MKRITFLVLILAVFFNFADSASAQSKTRKPKKTITKTTPTVNEQPVTVAEPVQTPTKKNERPAEETASPENAEKADNASKSNARPSQEKQNAPIYFYTFSQPEFLVSKIFIEHDENGRGKISFRKRDFNDLITDPIQLSPAALERIKVTFAALDFLNSKETYQSPDRNYAHLGTMTFAEKKDGRERTVEFNWTENKDAKVLADEYRRIGQQFVWIFDMSVARENQTLETPALMDALDSLIKRNEISDAVQMIPLLTDLSNDERLPLIARNHATRIAKSIEKSKK